MEFQGKLIVFSGPSGSGKTSIVKALLKDYPQTFGFSISATTRRKRKGEEDGKDYYFISEEAFRKKNSHKHLLFDIDVEGGLNIKKLYGDKVRTIFVMPPDIQTLEERLKKRKTESEESLKKRIDKAKAEIEKSKYFDCILLNNDLQTTIEKAKSIVLAFIK